MSMKLSPGSQVLQDREYAWPKLVFGVKIAHKSKSNDDNENGQLMSMSFLGINIILAAVMD